jgi:anaerobic magnesium-protoporphyrin IX monomethyl ester cyclase
MKVLLVQTPNGRLEKPIYPLGLAHLAGALGSSYELVCYDPAFSIAPLRDLVKLVRSFKPEVVCVSLRNIDSGFLVGNFWYYRALAPTLKAIRSAGYNGPIILGGAGFSLFAPQIMAEQPEADLGIVFEAEEALPRLLSDLSHPEQVPGTFWRQNEEIKSSMVAPAGDLTHLPRANYAVVDPKPYRDIPFAVGVQSKRGCALRCAYCTYPWLERTLRLRPGADVLAEVEELARLGMRDFTFVDSEFGKPRPHALELAKGLGDIGNKLAFSVWLSEDECDTEMVNLLKRGCLHHIEFSPDAYDDGMLTKLGKNITRNDIDKALETVAKDDKIGASFNFFVGSPGETIGTLWRKFRFRSRVKHMLGERYMGMGFATIRIYPHTALWEQATSRDHTFPHDYDLLHNARYYYRGFPATFAFRTVLWLRNMMGKNRAPLQDLSWDGELS